MTISLVERLNEYASGKRPGKIRTQPNSSTRAPASQSSGTWTAEAPSKSSICLGYHPETSEELLPVTPEIVDRWKAQQGEPPHRVDPETYPLFDPKTGRPNIWHSPGEKGALEFFDGPGFHPRTGKTVTEITQDFAYERLRGSKSGSRTQSVNDKRSSRTQSVNDKRSSRTQSMND